MKFRIPFKVKILPYSHFLLTSFPDLDIEISLSNPLLNYYLMILCFFGQPSFNFKRLQTKVRNFSDLYETSVSQEFLRIFWEFWNTLHFLESISLSLSLSLSLFEKVSFIKRFFKKKQFKTILLHLERNSRSKRKVRLWPKNSLEWLIGRRKCLTWESEKGMNFFEKFLEFFLLSFFFFFFQKINS